MDPWFVSAPVPVLVVSTDGVVLVVNAAAARAYGYTEREMVGQTLQLPGPHAEAGTGCLRDLVADGPAGPFHLTQYRKDGTPLDLLVSCSAVEHAGEPALLCVAQNISERVVAEKALKDSEERWRRLVEHHPEPLGILDFEGRVLYANPTGLRLLGARTVEEIGDVNLFDLVVPEQHEVMHERFSVVRRGGAAEPFVYRLLDASGDERTIEVRSIPIVYRGVPAVQAIARDVTERMRRERELIDAKEQAEQMNRLKTAFLANMSHEIRTPLTAIVGFSEILADNADATDHEFAMLIQRSGDRLLRTLNSVLDLAQLESGTLNLFPETVDLVDELDRAVDLFRLQAQDRGLSLTLERPDYLVEAVLDQSALERIVTNLVANALKFTLEGGVTVATRAVGDEVEFTVADTGVGIDGAFVPHLFDEFKQESSGRGRDFEGSGLGLTITRHLVELMQGDISVETEKGRGSTFTVRLPKDLRAAAEHVSPY